MCGQGVLARPADIETVQKAEVFVVGEVKTSAYEFTAQQLEKDIRVARKLDADVYLIAAPDRISEETRSLAGNLCKDPSWS